jgi:hypothetical protein
MERFVGTRNYSVRRFIQLSGRISKGLVCAKLCTHLWVRTEGIAGPFESSVFSGTRRR